MTEPTQQERQQIDAILKRVVAAFGDEEVRGDIDWEVHNGELLIRKGATCCALAIS